MMLGICGLLLAKLGPIRSVVIGLIDAGSGWTAGCFYDTREDLSSPQSGPFTPPWPDSAAAIEPAPATVHGWLSRQGANVPMAQ